MDTPQFQGAGTTLEGTQSATDFVSRSSGGSPAESNVVTIPSMGERFQEADPIYLCKAICIVFDRRQLAGEKPSGDKKLHSTRKHRPALVAEIESVWYELTECDPEDDIFPYHESYVILKWMAFRKSNDCIKAAWIAASKD